MKDSTVRDKHNHPTSEEVNNDHAELSFARLSCSSDGVGRVTIEGLAENGHDQRDWNIRIGLDLNDGSYDYDASPAE